MLPPKFIPTSQWKPHQVRFPEGKLYPIAVTGEHVAAYLVRLRDSKTIFSSSSLFPLTKRKLSLKAYVLTLHFYVIVYLPIMLLYFNQIVKSFSLFFFL